MTAITKILAVKKSAEGQFDIGTLYVAGVEENIWEARELAIKEVLLTGNDYNFTIFIYFLVLRNVIIEFFSNNSLNSTTKNKYLKRVNFFINNEYNFLKTCLVETLPKQPIEGY